MKIAIDITPVALLGGPREGIYRYLKELFSGLEHIDGRHEYILFFNFLRKRHVKAAESFCSQFKKMNYKKVISRFPPQLRLKFDLPIEMFTGNVDIFHGPAHLLPKVTSGKSIVTIHDLAFLKMKELSGNGTSEIPDYLPDSLKEQKPYRRRLQFFKQLKRNIARTIERADMIIAISQFTKNDILEMFDVNKDKIRVIYNGVSGDFLPVEDKERVMNIRKKYGIENNYLFYLGLLDPNKNLIRLLEAFGKLRSSLNSKHSLVIAGDKNWFYPCLLRKVQQLHLENEVIFTGFVPDEDLPFLYSGADLLIQPSALEGFGLPVLEAMACGVPVVAARAGSLPEIVEEAGILVDSRSPAGIAEGMYRILSDNGLAAELRKKGKERSRSFSWEETAKQTLQVYKEVVS